MDGVVKLFCVSENNYNREFLFIIGQLNPVNELYWGENRAGKGAGGIRSHCCRGSYFDGYLHDVLLTLN